MQVVPLPILQWTRTMRALLNNKKIIRIDIDTFVFRNNSRQKNVSMAKSIR